MTLVIDGLINHGHDEVSASAPAGNRWKSAIVPQDPISNLISKHLSKQLLRSGPLYVFFPAVS